MIYIRKYIISFVTSIYVKYDHYNKIQKKKKKTDSHIFYEEIRMRTNKDLFYKKREKSAKTNKILYQKRQIRKTEKLRKK